MNTWKGIIAKTFNQEQFEQYLRSLSWPTWRPQFIVLHNTAIPTLAQRPQGLTIQHIRDLEIYYRDTQHWSAGPHLFIDDRQIWVFSPLTGPGVHSPSWNSISWGIEMVGDYNTEDFNTGRGLLVRQNAVAAIASLSTIIGLQADSLHLHHEDPKTTHKGCPGKNVVKSQIIAEVQALIEQRHSGDHSQLIKTGL